MLAKRKSVTASDLEALEAMPEGWFGAFDRWSSGVARPQFRIDRLCAAGYLEVRSVGVYPDNSREYRKVQEQ